MEPARRPLSLYVHVPFCVRKCRYCDFLSFPAGEQTFRKYFEALNEEIRRFPHPERFHVVSVFFGGGTPSLPSSLFLAETFGSIRRHFQVDEGAEITLECNPGTLSPEKLQAYREIGVSRLSIGLQSSHNTLLRSLGRIHTWETFCEEYRHAANAGFDNISVDLMYDLPGQTDALWRETLSDVLALSPRPAHISAYSLIIEPGTPFWDLYHEDDEAKKRGEQPLFLPSEEEESYMLAILKQVMQEHGYHRYEISSWALHEGMPSRDFRESIHNKGYWERREYAGFGIGASSQIEHSRYKNTVSLSSYVQGVFTPAEYTELTLKDEISETMFLGLREMKGVSREAFYRRFGVEMDELYGSVISPLVKEGLLIDGGRGIRLSERGIELSNLVLAEFLLD